MSILEMFKKYQSKPVERLAYKIKETDSVWLLRGGEVAMQTEKSTTGERVVYFNNSAVYLKFVAHEFVNVGDYIVFLNDIDIYHCNAKVFAERNIVEVGDE